MSNAVAGGEQAGAVRQEPTPAQLQAAVELVVERLEPDQVILFGSAARRQMREYSDIDLLVLKPSANGGPAIDQHHWACEGWGGYVDVLVMDREHAEAGRFIAGDVRQPALEDGRTLYARAGVAPVETGPADRGNGREMARKTLFDPEHGAVLLEKAETALNFARTTMRADVGSRCEQLHKCMEHGYKALLASRGERVEHVHDLHVLQTTCTAAGANQPGTRDAGLLETLTKYGGEFRYAPPSAADSEAVFKKALPLVEKLYEYAERNVPAFAQQTRAAVDAAKQPGAPPAKNTPPSHPAAAGTPVKVGSTTAVRAPDAAPNAPAGGPTTGTER